ncbi:hypothetical protein KI387_013414 [Taxus chinensis]|uniref:DUF7913 domain-containing protein n=1 Tax=Taxus chinensis TaxID=29808 RepID=A0AA38CL83_TAXCH|nr:hypothetical protein KI387_013414 [Taxus chinensis]
MELDDEMPPKEDSIQAFIGYLVEPTLNKIGRYETPPPSAHEQVAKQMQAVVLLYNYYLRKQFPHLEFLDALTFCKTAVVMYAKLIKYMGILKGTGTNQSASEFVQQATITEKMVKEACDTCEALNSPRTMLDINTLPVSKVAVFVVDAAYERCILIFGSITRGVWSLVEKDVEGFDRLHGVTVEIAKQNKEKVLRKRPLGDMPSGIRVNETAINEPKLLGLAFSAVKEQTEAKRIEEDLRSQLKTKEEDCEKCGYEIVALRKDLEKANAKLTNNLRFEKSTEVLDEILGLQRSLFNKSGLGYREELEKASKSTKLPKKTSAKKAKSYAKILKEPTKNESRKEEDITKTNTVHKEGNMTRKDATNVDGISEAFESAQYIKGQNSVASDNQDSLAQSYGVNGTKLETLVPNISCTIDEMVNSEADLLQNPIDSGKAVKSGSQQVGSAADIGRRKTAYVSKLSQKPLSPVNGKPNAIEKFTLTTKDVGDTGKSARQSCDKYLHSMPHVKTATEQVSSPSRTGMHNRSDMELVQETVTVRATEEATSNGMRAGGQETHIPLSSASFGRPWNNNSNGMQKSNLENKTIGDREKFSNGMQVNWISTDCDLLKAAIEVISEKRDKLFEDLIMGQSHHQSQSKELLSKIAECDVNMEMILRGGKDAMILAKEIQHKTLYIGPKVAINDMKRRKLSEGILFLRSSSQELSDICVKNRWSMPSYFVSIPSDSYAKECFYATVKIRGYDFELEEAGELKRGEMEAKESAASLMLSRLYRMSASSRE